jgi:leucyl aminopeptidase (aminopeptidase T)
MRYREGLSKLFRENFRLKKSERVLVFADLPDAKNAAWVRQHHCAREAAELAAELAGGSTLVEYAPTGTHGAEPPAGLWAEFFGAEAIAALERGGVLGRLLAKQATPRDLSAAEKILRAGVGAAPQVVVGLSHYSTTHTRFRGFATGLAKSRYASMPIFDPLMFSGPMAVDWIELKPE